jgi:DNA-binding MarR family transcriptional regulator
MKKRQRRRRAQPDAGTAVLRSFRIIYGSVRKHFREVQRTCGISGSQLWILHEIAKSQGIGVSDLAVKLSIHQSTCSQLVEKLVRAGYVRKARGSGDQRRVDLALTGAGRRILARAPGPTEGVLPEAIAELSPAQRRALGRNLDAVIAALDLIDEQAAHRHLSDL